MTAQAGAVAFRYSYEVARGVYAETRWLGMDELHHYGENGDLVKGPSPHWQRVEYAYTTPPAAVPVEALKALVAGWRIDGVVSDKYADELTQLIKERSNG